MVQSLHICASRTNNRHISFFETYPTLVFGVSKTIHVLMFGTRWSYHLPRLICYLDGLIFIHDCRCVGLVRFISREGYTSNLVE